MKENLLKDLSFRFAIDIVKMSRVLQDSKKEWILSKQLMKCGTSIGALIREAEFAQSKPDFINKLSVALKEANETNYWIDLLTITDFIDVETSKNLLDNLKLIISLLVKSIKTSKRLN